MRPNTEGRLDRYRIGISQELFETHTQPWLSEGSLTYYPCQKQPKASCITKSHITSFPSVSAKGIC